MEGNSGASTVEQNRRVIFLYSAFQFFFSLLVWVPIFYEFQKRIGLEDTQIFQVQSFYYIIFCLLEIPTGYLADRLGYTKCIKWGAWSLVVANLFPIFAQSFGGFIAHYFMIALARSFISGASAAYLYEFLAQNNCAQEYKKVEGRARAYGLIGKVLCWSVVGVLMQWHLTLPYWLTFVSAIISVGYAYALPELRPLNSDSRLQKFADAGMAIKHLFSSPYLLFVVLQGIGIFTLVRVAQVDLYQPILRSKEFDLVAFGWIMSVMTIFEALGSGLTGRVQGLVKDRRAVSLTTILMALALIAIPYFGQAGTMASLFLFAIAAGLSFPIQKQLMNDAIGSSTRFRASILSLESLIDRAVCAWMASQIGASLKEGRLDTFLTNTGLVTIAFIGLLTVLFYLVKYRRRQMRALSLEGKTA